MALQSSTVWEMRITGSNDNGGGYTSGGTDYSQQDASQLSVTDGATSGIGITVFTSVIGGFAAAMVGNIIYLRSGTNLTVGWYEITAYTNGNTVTLDRAPDDGVGGVSGGTGEVGGARVLPTAAFLSAFVAGNHLHIKAGTYTLSEIHSIQNDGTSISPIIVEGYNAARGDKPTGTDRPLIAAGANGWRFDNYWIHKYLRATLTDTNGFRVDAEGIIECCASNNSSGTTGRSGITLVQAMVINSEAQSVNGEAVDAINPGSRVITNYLHDSNMGVDLGGDDIIVIGNIIAACPTGISDTGVVGTDGITVANNTIYNGITGISVNDGSRWAVYNNIIDSFTTGASWTTEQGANFFDYNCWNNTTDVSNVTKGSNAVTANPSMTDPANGDFTLQSGSPCLDAGMSVGVNQGAVGSYKWNIGADQDDVATAGGGLLTHPGMAGGMRA